MLRARQLLTTGKTSFSRSGIDRFTAKLPPFRSSHSGRAQWGQIAKQHLHLFNTRAPFFAVRFGVAAAGFGCIKSVVDWDDETPEIDISLIQKTTQSLNGATHPHIHFHFHCDEHHPNVASGAKLIGKLVQHRLGKKMHQPSEAKHAVHFNLQEDSVGDVEVNMHALPVAFAKQKNILVEEGEVEVSDIVLNQSSRACLQKFYTQPSKSITHHTIYHNNGGSDHPHKFKSVFDIPPREFLKSNRGSFIYASLVTTIRLHREYTEKEQDLRVPVAKSNPPVHHHPHKVDAAAAPAPEYGVRPLMFYGKKPDQPKNKEKRLAHEMGTKASRFRMP